MAMRKCAGYNTTPPPLYPPSMVVVREIQADGPYVQNSICRTVRYARTLSEASPHFDRTTNSRYIAQVVKDETGRPFIIVREYVACEDCHGKSIRGRIADGLQPRQEEEAVWQRSCQVTHFGRADCGQHRQDFSGRNTGPKIWAGTYVARDPADWTRS